MKEVGYNGLVCAVSGVLGDQSATLSYCDCSEIGRMMAVAKMMCRHQLPGTDRMCNRISDKGLCPAHRTNNARGYGSEHRKTKKVAMEIAPYCWKCGCLATTCRLQWHHVTELQGGRNPEKDDRRQLLCIKCHNELRERG